MEAEHNCSGDQEAVLHTGLQGLLGSEGDLGTESFFFFSGAKEILECDDRESKKIK